MWLKGYRDVGVTRKPLSCRSDEGLYAPPPNNGQKSVFLIFGREPSTVERSTGIETDAMLSAGMHAAIERYLISPFCPDGLRSVWRRATLQPVHSYSHRLRCRGVYRGN